jgi:hypothetical protein
MGIHATDDPLFSRADQASRERASSYACRRKDEATRNIIRKEDIMKVKVTRKHIEDAKGDIFYCPIDRAIGELLEVRVLTGTEAVHFDYKGTHFDVPLPKKARTWVHHHDANIKKLEKVKPITFELDFEYV